jgi:RimJ/RimL family protein N-acetyltransferase
MIDLTFERAREADVPFIMATERMDGYDRLVGRWDEAKHLSAVNDDHYAYFLAKDVHAPIGFAIVRDWASPERVACLKRIAVVKPGKRTGRRLLGAVVDAIFRETDAHRVWLGVFLENERARRAYEAVGFRAEGVARGNAFFGGTFHDELIMAILKPEWVPVSDRD